MVRVKIRQYAITGAPQTFVAVQFSMRFWKDQSALTTNKVSQLTVPGSNIDFDWQTIRHGKSQFFTSGSKESQVSLSTLSQTSSSNRDSLISLLHSLPARNYSNLRTHSQCFLFQAPDIKCAACRNSHSAKSTSSFYFQITLCHTVLRYAETQCYKINVVLIRLADL